MPDQTAALAIASLRPELLQMEALLDAQSNTTRQFLRLQAQRIAEAMQHKTGQVRFTLPDRINNAAGVQLTIDAGQREQSVGGGLSLRRRSVHDVGDGLRQRLDELRAASEDALQVCADLIMHACARFIVHDLLPAGRSVTYTAEESGDIPAQPADSGLDPESAITQASDAISEEGAADAGRGTLQVPFTPYARRFYLPQWVALDDAARLLVGADDEAESMIASMQNFVYTIHQASGLAPYIIADAVYQQKRGGMLGQLVNQGRALAVFRAGQIIGTVQQRAAANSLNRGLHLSLPYFDDHILAMAMHDVEVIPPGRIQFARSLMVRAVRLEEANVSQDTRLSPATRRHLLALLEQLAAAFSS